MSEVIPRRPILPWLAAVAALVAGVALGAAFGPKLASLSGRRAAAPAPNVPRAPVGCSGDTCLLAGQPGRCVRGECIATGGLCTADGDCDDGNPCTRDRCQEGHCTLAVEDGTCRTASGADGLCLEATCQPSARVACAFTAECPPQAMGCAEAACLDGRCGVTRRADGAPCTTAAGRTGVCQMAVCASAPGDGATEVCVMEWDPYQGDVRRCRTGIRYRLAAEELARGEERLEQLAGQVLRYDLKASFVELPDGGYNLVLRNRRPPDQVRGAADPALAAWLASSFASTSGWRARQVVLWLGADGSGWSAPTRGGEPATQAARDRGPAAGLGGAEAYRSWLESHLTRLPPGATPPATPAR
jgi:hypothetical protein